VLVNENIVPNSPTWHFTEARMPLPLLSVTVPVHDFVMATTQVNWKAQNSTHRHAETPLLNLASVIDDTWHAKLCSHQFWGFLLVVLFLFWFFNKATAYTPERIFTQNMSQDVVPGKEVPFGVPDDYLIFSYIFCRTWRNLACQF